MIKMRESVEQQPEKGDLGDKVLHPDFQRARDLASSNSDEFHAALNALGTNYSVMEREKGRLEKELERERLRNETLSQALKNPKSLEIPTSTDLPTDEFIDRSLAKLDVVLVLEESRINLGKERKRSEAYRKENERLKQLAIRDGMTGAYNHTYFIDQLEHEVDKAKRKEYKNPLAILILDIDHFKLFNDKHGHQAGDYVLKQLTKTADDVLRGSDVFARYGGEEFVVILPGTDIEEAEEVGERFREAIKNDHLVYEGKKLNVTVSMGVASLRPESVVNFVKQADAALYVAKDLGRDCTVTREYAENELGIDLAKYKKE